MKPARLALIVLAVLLGTVAVALGLLFNSSVQRWAFLRAANTQPGLKADVARISAGPGAMTLQGAKFSTHGISVAVESLEADYSLWAYLVKGRIEIKRIAARGVVVDARSVSRMQAGVGATTGPVAVPGILSRIQLPAELWLGEIDLQGQALLPGASGHEPVQSEFKITGGKIGPAMEGEILLDAKVRDPTPAARVSAISVKMRMTVLESSVRTFDRIGVTAAFAAEGPQLKENNQLNIAARIARDPSGETYSLKIDTTRLGQAEELFALRATLAKGAQEYKGDWKLRAKHSQLEPFFLGGRLPEFDANGQGQFNFDPVAALSNIQGQLQIVADELGAIQPSLRALGAVKINTAFDIEREGFTARIRRFDLDISGDRPVLELRANGAAEINFLERRLSVGPGASGEIVRLKLLGLPLAWIRPFVKSVDLSGGRLQGEISIAEREGHLRAETIAPLTIDSFTVVQAGKILIDRAAINLRSRADISRDQVQIHVPEFLLTTVAGDRVAIQTRVILPEASTSAAIVDADYQADLPALLTPFLPLGHIKATGQVSLKAQGDNVHIFKSSLNVTDALGGKLLSAATLREVQIDLTNGAVKNLTSSTDLLRLSVGKLALSPFIPVIDGLVIKGGVEQAELFLSADEKALTLRSETPVRLSGIAVTRDGRLAARDLGIEFSPTVVATRLNSIQIQSGDMTVRTVGGVTLLTAKADATRSPDGGLAAGVSFQLELPAIATQPFLVGSPVLSQGRASGELRAAFTEQSKQIEARLTVNGLVLADDKRALPVANLSFRGVAAPDGKISLEIPVLLDRAGQRSDLNLSANLERAGSGFEGEVRLVGHEVEIDDALMLVGIFYAPSSGSDSKSTATKAPPISKTPDKTAAWSGFKGRVLLDLKSLSRGKDWAMTGVTGRAELGPGEIKLPIFEGSFGGNSHLSAKANLTFVPGAEPYRLAGDFSLTQFDSGKFFKAFEPGRPATLEGMFTVNGVVSSTGANISHTIDRTSGRLDLASQQGIFRGLRRSAEKVSATTKAVELGANVLGSLFGQDKITKAAEKIAGQAYFIDQLAATLAELRYDQFSLRVTRDHTLSVNLENVSLIAPEIRLTGRGLVNHVEGKSLLEQPLTAELTISSRGKIEQNFAKVGFLDGTRDDLDYAKMKMPVIVGGTLAKPDPSPFFSRLAKSKLAEFLVPESN